MVYRTYETNEDQYTAYVGVFAHQLLSITVDRPCAHVGMSDALLDRVEDAYVPE